MKRILPLFIVIFCAMNPVLAQKKSELISQNQELKFQLDSIKRLVSTAESNEKISMIKAEELQSQVSELQAANATLLKNLNSFAALSSQNSENINKTLATLERKEAQLKGIVDAVASNDSTAIVVLTNAKQSLGENAKVQVSNGKVVISEKLDFYFADGLGTTVQESAKIWLENVSKIIKANPKSTVTVSGLSMTGELEVALDQAASVAQVLIKDFGVEGNRINAQGLDGGFKEGIQIEIHPDYKTFYAIAKEDAKN
ncbi:hypothetical protein PP182_13020 [Maribacter sp. PR1]|uniref:OmpA-like domain-containing protein n=1 Tax=Maribacter cobaltidurans TaxID=1178778 RepID=A0ABU7IVI1_9FLAO|nr:MULTISPECIES: hypothetical protein [Maribacter]MDC6389613.1 hypothetical protein [Maribacter sp. PR1]MEE1977002.1 hypothetical protein [Maribacter cobaltidurans]